MNTFQAIWASVVVVVVVDSKVNHPEYNLGLSLKVAVKRFKELLCGNKIARWKSLIELLSNMQRLSLIMISLFLCLLKMVTQRTRIVTLPMGWQTTLASLLCPQFSIPHPWWLHRNMDFSFPKHPTLSSHIGPVPCPNAAALGADKAPSYPSWRHATSASCEPHKLSQMVPHFPL